MKRVKPLVCWLRVWAGEGKTAEVLSRKFADCTIRAGYLNLEIKEDRKFKSQNADDTC